MTEETTQPEAQQTEQAAPATVDLTVQDLAGLRSVVEVASSRGAFKAGEMEAVGKLFNKLSAFLETVTKAAPAAGQE